MNVSVVVERLRNASLNRMISLVSPMLQFGIVEIGPLPLYNEGLDDDPSAQWTACRERTKASDPVLFVTPEYNRSLPAALRTALDVGSMPYGSSVE